RLVEVESVIEASSAPAGHGELGDSAHRALGFDRLDELRAVVTAARLRVDDDLLQLRGKTVRRQERHDGGERVGAYRTAVVDHVEQNRRMFAGEVRRDGALKGGLIN